MPLTAIGLHVLIASLCAAHWLRNRQQPYWLWVVFGFPVLGSLIYLLAVALPDAELDRHARRALQHADRVLDPLRPVREAQARFNAVASTEHRMQLAAALLGAGLAEEAAREYQTCLQGMFAADPDICIGLASAWVACGRRDDALRGLLDLRARRPAFRPEVVERLIAAARRA